MLVPAFGGCGITEEGGLSPDGGTGADGGIGGTGVGGGTCFPGAKVCPDPKNPKDLLCLTADEPAYGCSNSTACSPCLLPHAKAKCNAGNCAVGSCDAGWDDCNGNPVDGCETDLTGDKEHCSKCDNNCLTAAGQGPGWICTSGVCEVNQCCPDGNPACVTKQDCDLNKQNGCEVDLATDANNCKTCGNVCSLPHAQSSCSQETCVVTVCSGGWANCDKNDVNGCEINISQGDKGNCGACGKACNETNGGATCQGGNCVLACFPGFGNCDNNPDNGCETDLKSNPLHCNICGKACNPQNAQAALCDNGACSYTACKAGFADCDGNKANGCEINILQDKNNCGGCGSGFVCQAPSGGSVVCNAGTCAQACGSGLTNCSGVCVPTATDINNCGGCGSKCTPPANATATCSGGGCGFNCNGGWASCGTTQCYQNGSDPTHCCSGGGCNNACTNCPGPGSGTGSATCSAGTCGINCSPPTAGKCGSSCFDFQTDKNHCNNCATKCVDPSNGTNNCVTGACKLTCDSGYHDCSGLCKSSSDVGSCGTNCSPCPGPSAGTGTTTCGSGTCGINCTGGTPDLCGTACVNKQTDKLNCGTCGKTCSASETCCSGGCADLTNDDNNCGVCGKKCLSSETCTASKCCPNGGPDAGASDGGGC